ncbi:MAG: DUF2254 domain-containing protein [Nocardioides sp.]
MSARMLVERVTQAFWGLPALGAVLAAVGALVTVRLDRAYGGAGGLLYAGGPDSARAILQTVASSVLTFAGLTFSITIVALQLASSQFSPRVLTSLLRDRWTQGALAVFVGTFVYALLMLRDVRGGDDSFVPGLGVGLSLLLGLAAIGALVGFIQHMAHSLRVVTIIDRIFAQTQKALAAWYPDERSVAPEGRVVGGPRAVVRAQGDGVLAWFHRDELVARAEADDLTVELLVPAGTWVAEGQELLAVHGMAESCESFSGLVGLGRERETSRDPSYGFRQLVDIAERALSPGVNDPTTAVQCLDRMHSLLRCIATRELAVGDTVVDGVVRLRVPVPDWSDYLGLACDEVRHWGAGSVRVHRRMESMLRDLRGVAPGLRAEAVDAQLERLVRRRDDEVAEEWQAVARSGDPAEWLADRDPA